MDAIKQSKPARKVAPKEFWKLLKQDKTLTKNHKKINDKNTSNRYERNE